ncbi:MAG: preprotein translocase subunit SecA [Muribaculaceae bacterium]|nr:preprotein translocase subunit SecA [Muribaculaceae bacterium]
MNFIQFISSLFGTKSDRDMKQIQPLVDEVLKVYPEINALSNDELRARTLVLKEQIREAGKPLRAQIDELKAKIEHTDIQDRKPIFDKIDKLEKEILEEYEKVLNEIRPVAFAIVKSTAERFTNNENIEVTATDFDRELAARHDFVDIEGDKAIYHNHWVAGGNETLWNMIHYDVQLFGGTVLHQGKIAEMATGEGKTLVATLPVFLNALTGNGVHVVTVNDYLAKRDSEWMGPLYMFHGSTVDCIDKTQPNSPERRKAYQCDITFGTNNEFGFDYLRDNMAMAPLDMVQRPHYYAIVDEVDSVLIDDARTPLIISGPTPKGEDQMFDQFKANVERVVDAQRRLITQTLIEAKAKIADPDEKVRKEGALLLLRCYKGLPKNSALIKFLSQEGMKPLLLKTEAFYMQDNSREMHQATDPLYFIIDEKLRSVELTDKGIDTLTGKSEDPQFFVLPDIASQLSELENIKDIAEKQLKKDELLQNYSIKSERVHTVTQLLKAYTLFDKDVEYVIDNDEIKIVDEQTGRIMEGRRYSDGLHQAIEAKENVKVQAATQTFATITLQNYFRMYEKLAGMTGTAITEAGEFWDIYKLDVVTIPTNKPVARIDMNDRVFKTKKEKYAAVIAEIERLRAEGRPVLVGTTSVEISELLSRMLQMRRIEHNVLNAKLHQKEAEIVALAGRKGVVTIATNMAGRGTDIKLTPEVKEAGGLAIIGTERHESRRVDRQLRGRSGRQGDPGSSVFYVSFEDQLMRIFASDRVTKLLDTLGLKEGEMIEAKMVTRAIENAQKRVEENNFGIRKRNLEYDDVMNKQRQYIYNRRHHALLGERIGIDISNMIYDITENLVDTYNAPTDYGDLSLEVFRALAIEMPFPEEQFQRLSREEIIDMIHTSANQALQRKSERIIEVANPVIRRFVEDHPEHKGRIIVPINDGKRTFNLPVSITDAYESGCKSIVKEWHKAILLVTIDELWKEHLRELDQLRQSVQNASYEQKDPLVIYKLESFNLFANMLNNLNVKAISSLMRGQIPIQPEQETRVREAMPERRNDYSKYRTSREEFPGDQQRRVASQRQGEQQAPQPVRNTGPRVGRNDPCPCGSGKKFKNCHGRDMGM